MLGVLHSLFSCNSTIMVSLATVAGGVVAALALFGAAVAIAVFFVPKLRALPAAWLEKHLFPDPNQVILRTAAQQKHKTNGMARNVYRILAFGDSLTEGFTNGGNAFHPYVKRLGDTMYKHMAKDWHLEIEEQGESGERVLMGMNHRLQRTLDEHTAANRMYDWVLLLGGINDLGGDESTAEEVMHGLDVLVQKCLKHGANVLLMTLLEVAMPQEQVEQQRQKLNSMIKDYVVQRNWDKQEAASNSSTQQPGAAAAAGGAKRSDGSAVRRTKPQVHLFDLSKALPYEALDQQQQWDFWDDGVHLTMAGYDHMGGLIAEALLPLMQQELEHMQAAVGTDKTAHAAGTAAAAAAAAEGKKAK